MVANPEQELLKEKISRLWTLKQQQDDVNEQLNIIKRTRAELEKEILDSMERIGTTIAGDGEHVVSRTESIVPTVEDWDACYRFILETQQPFLLERRFLASAFRELHSAGHEVPGVRPFTKVGLSIRAKKSGG